MSSAVPATVDPDAIRRGLDNDGYVVLRGLVSPLRLAELERTLVAEFERLRADGVLFRGGGSISGHLNCFPGAGSRFVLEELTLAGLVDVIGQIRPDVVDSVRATMNFNLPGSVAQHYHSDGLFTEEFLICNVAVVDTDLVNGALDVLPGTHREFYKFSRYAVRRLYRLSTRVPLRRGDVVVRRSTLWHRGMPNRSAAPRPMMAVTFGELVGQPSDPFSLNDGATYFFPNWYTTTRAGRAREQVFVRAPLVYSAYRFARSLYGNKGYSSW